jgi:hypothetical protein
VIRKESVGEAEIGKKGRVMTEEVKRQAELPCSDQRT